MNHLLPGMESPERLSLLLDGTDIRSDDLISALEDVYCRGLSQSAAAHINGIDAGNLSKAQTRLEHEAARIEAIKELDWARHGYHSRCRHCQPQIASNSAALSRSATHSATNPATNPVTSAAPTQEAA